MQVRPATCDFALPLPSLHRFFPMNPFVIYSNLLRKDVIHVNFLPIKQISGMPKKEAQLTLYVQELFLAGLDIHLAT